MIVIQFDWAPKHLTFTYFANQLADPFTDLSGAMFGFWASGCRDGGCLS